jgi:outer membrane protein TolC
MKVPIHHFLLSFLLYTFSLCAHEQECTSDIVLAMNLGECQELSLKTSEALNIAEIETLIAREKIREIQGIQEPKLSAEGRVTRRDKHPGGIDPGNVSKNKSHPKKGSDQSNETIRTISGRKAENNTRVGLIVPIYDSGLVANKKLAQAFKVEATEHDRDRIEQTLLNEVAQSYFTILQAKKIEGVVLQSIEILKRQKKTSEDLFSVGFITKHDILVVDVQLSERQEELIQARNNKETAKASLNRLMGRSLQTLLEVQDVSENIVCDSNYISIVKKADICHPELKRIEANRDALPYDYNAIRAEHLPQINAFLDYNTSSDHYLLHKHWLFGGVGIQIPILDGGIVESKMKQKKEEMDAATFRLKGAQEDIHLDIKKAYLKLEASFHKIPVDLTRIRESEENLRIAADLYQEGLLSSDDLMNDEQKMTQAKAHYYQSLYQWYMSKSSLQYAAGIIKPEKPVQQESP